MPASWLEVLVAHQVGDCAGTALAIQDGFAIRDELALGVAAYVTAPWCHDDAYTTLCPRILDGIGPDERRRHGHYRGASEDVFEAFNLVLGLRRNLVVVERFRRQLG